VKYPAGISGEEYAAMEEGYEQGRAEVRQRVRAVLVDIGTGVKSFTYVQEWWTVKDRLFAALDGSASGPAEDCRAVGFSGEGRCIEPAVAGGLCAEHSTRERDRLRALLEEAYDLVDGARYHTADPGLSRSWGQRRRRFRDAVLALREGLGDR